MKFEEIYEKTTNASRTVRVLARQRVTMHELLPTQNASRIVTFKEAMEVPAKVSARKRVTMHEPLPAQNTSRIIIALHEKTKKPDIAYSTQGAIRILKLR